MNPDDQPLINIPFAAHQRAKRTAIEYMGRNWGAGHDRFTVRWLFRRGYISDFEREQLEDNIAEKVAETRKRNPNYGRFRLY